MTRIRYLLCYDVTDDRRLRRVANVAEEFGHRVQYSVFVCDLSRSERLRFEQRLAAELDLALDRALLVDLGPSATAADRVRWLAHGRPAAFPPAPGSPQIV